LGGDAVNSFDEIGYPDFSPAIVAWNDYEIGNKASSRDTKAIAKRIKKAVETAAEYCKVDAPSPAPLDASLLYPAQSRPAQ
jgi:hypothetical protein